jgi:hypothetical protein
MSSADARARLEMAEAEEQRLVAKRQAIEDRLAHLKGQASALQLPAVHEGDATARAQLDTVEASVLELTEKLANTRPEIKAAQAVVEQRQAELKAAVLAELEVEYFRAELAATQQWLTRFELIRQVDETGRALDAQVKQARELARQVRKAGGPQYEPCYSLAYDDEGKAKDLRRRLAQLAEKVSV